jgi:3-oxoacyl-[acyl-carrier-protein] synthase II
MMGAVPVITGLGVVSPVGGAVPEFWDSLLAGRQGFSEIPYFDASPYRNAKAGVVGDLEGPGELGRGAGYASAAVREALADASLDGLGEAGIVTASNFGASSRTEAALRSGGDTTGCEGFPSVTGMLCGEFGVPGPAITLSLSCASGAAAIACACDQIILGRAAAMVAVGYEEIAEIWYSGLSALRAITSDTIRPFDAERAGTLFGEGAGAMVIEDAERAAARGARVYARVAGYEMNNDAYHMTAPDPQGSGTRRVVESALAMAGMDPSGIDYVNAHGTGTEYNDRTETAVLKAVMGERAYRVPVVSIKSMVSHMMGAAGIVEAISCCLSMRDGMVPPTVGLVNPDPECDLDYCPGGAVKREVSAALSNSAGIGGTNCAVLMTRYGGEK